MPDENQYKFPGIYIHETSSFQHTVPALNTSIPAFIGCTLSNEMSAHKISSLADYVTRFGQGEGLYRHMQLFFDNGGSECFVVSSGTSSPQPDAFLSCLQLLSGQQESTLLVIPEATSLKHDEYAILVKAMLQHCASMTNRFAIIDVYGGTEYSTQVIDDHRKDVGENNLRYGASYFPFLITDGDAQVLPASAAVAGAVCKTDLTRGIWKSPANLSLSGVLGPAVSISEQQQELLNVDAVSGKSINAIRKFPGKGTLIWGARTLDGNSNEWRYIPVQRFCSWVKACIEKGLEPFAFEPNEAGTWLKVKAMTENFLYSLWKQGALTGSKPEHGYFVKTGIGETMTAQDIADGRLITEVGLAVVRPAEFIILRFSTAVS